MPAQSTLCRRRTMSASTKRAAKWLAPRQFDERFSKDIRLSCCYHYFIVKFIYWMLQLLRNLKYALD
jgi:hypothetical protein